MGEAGITIEAARAPCQVAVHIPSVAHRQAPCALRHLVQEVVRSRLKTAAR
jgi:hypothetical protein